MSWDWGDELYIFPNFSIYIQIKGIDSTLEHALCEWRWRCNVNTGRYCEKRCTPTIRCTSSAQCCKCHIQQSIHENTILKYGLPKYN